MIYDLFLYTLLYVINMSIFDMYKYAVNVSIFDMYLKKYSQLLISNLIFFFCTREMRAT